MRSNRDQQTVTQSVLERLIDREPDSGKDPTVTQAQSVRQLKTSLRRDLEWLLNTRRIPDDAPASLRYLHRSLFNFGLPDVTSLSHESPADRARLLQLVESTVTTFEPRLTRVRVTHLEAPRGVIQVMRFQIEGMLMMDPEPEHISFDTVLQLTSGHYDVKGEPSAG